jgi:hypothetical protein
MSKFTYTTGTSGVPGDLTLESILKSVERFEDSKPEPYYDEIRGNAPTLMRFRNWWPTEKTSVKVHALATFHSRIPMVEDEYMPDGVVIFRGAKRKKHFMAILNLDDRTMSESSFDEDAWLNRPFTPEWGNGL